jgi:hypothetical protein
MPLTALHFRVLRSWRNRAPLLCVWPSVALRTANLRVDVQAPSAARSSQQLSRRSDKRISRCSTFAAGVTLKIHA